MANLIIVESPSKAKTLKNLIFLPRAIMKTKFPILEKFPFLLPIMWVVRWIDAVFNKQKSIKSSVNQLDHINDETVNSYNEELAKVGLKFTLNKK